MRYIIILLSIILILSCEKYGETIPLSGNKLVEIVHHNDGNKWSEKFSYDSSGRLIEINQIEREKYLFEYDGDRLHRIINTDWDDFNSSSYWNKNNILKSEVRDYTGLYDPTCNPCYTVYDYNLDDYPVKLFFAEYRKMTLYYE